MHEDVAVHRHWSCISRPSVVILVQAHRYAEVVLSFRNIHTVARPWSLMVMTPLGLLAR